MAFAARAAVVCSLLGLWGLPSLARANPEVQACEGKTEGNSCGVMKMVKPADGGQLQRKTVPGSCQADECCDLDYSKGSPPETVCHACLACKQGPPTVDTKTDGGAVSPRTSEGEPPRSDDGPPPPGPTEQRGCSIASDPVVVAPWLLAVFGLALVRRRN